jgi:hypothetical protein
MRTEPRRRRRSPDLETNVPPDALRDDLRRRDKRRSPPDSIPASGDKPVGNVPAGGGFTPAQDGGNAQHPIHDEDRDDATPSDYEREIDRLDAAVRLQSR